MTNKELEEQRKKIEEKTLFISWAISNDAQIDQITHSTDRFTNWDVCFTSGQTQQKVVCEMKKRGYSKQIYDTQLIEKYKWDFLMSLHTARPELLPLYLIIYPLEGNGYMSLEFDLRYVAQPQWETQQHWADNTRTKKVDKLVGYISNDQATRRALK
ncbi:MAG TPA: hypothetical protein PK886_03055 [Candidatus Paceibacterota bacterium]|nr:hypothetical protein [Candidatus Paceibacterota bacterium]